MIFINILAAITYIGAMLLIKDIRMKDIKYTALCAGGIACIGVEVMYTGNALNMSIPLMVTLMIIDFRKGLLPLYLNAPLALYSVALGTIHINDYLLSLGLLMIGVCGSACLYYAKRKVRAIGYGDVILLPSLALLVPAHLTPHMMLISCFLTVVIYLIPNHLRFVGGSRYKGHKVIPFGPALILAAVSIYHFAGNQLNPLIKIGDHL